MGYLCVWLAIESKILMGHKVLLGLYRCSLCNFDLQFGYFVCAVTTNNNILDLSGRPRERNSPRWQVLEMCLGVGCGMCKYKREFDWHPKTFSSLWLYFGQTPNAFNCVLHLECDTMSFIKAGWWHFDGIFQLSERECWLHQMARIWYVDWKSWWVYGKWEW